MLFANPQKGRSMKQRFSSLIIILLLTASTALAQGSLSGKITDADSGEELPGANIVISDGSGFTRGVTSNLTGDFLFPSVPAGTYRLQITYVGYTDEERSGIVVNDGEETVVNIELGAGVSLNPVVISASKTQEKVNEAPASIEVIDPIEIRNTSTATATDFIKGAKSVDVAQQGIMSQTVVARGFNNIFSGSLLVLVDNRIGRVPSLRANILHFISTTNDDIEQVELVLGPGSALYGPNVNSGIMHMITRSPLNTQGTDVSVFAGERNFLKGQFRTAHKFGDKVGFKISGQYMRADDFQLDENNIYRQQEVQNRIDYLANPNAPGYDPAVAERIGIRDYGVEKFAFDSRLDIDFTDDFRAIFSGGYNQASNIDLTGLGAGQGVDWALYYGQARFLYKDFFAQAYINGTNSGDTYIIPTGLPIIDKSQLFVSQLQHNLSIDKFQITYGVDFLRTTPRTEGTINGQYENIDQVDEYGGYAQVKYSLSEKFDLLASARLDNHSELESPVFSPRAGLVYKPKPGHTFRFTYNRSFGTPSSNNLWLDLLAARVNTGVALPSGAFNYQVRAQGVPSSGFNFGGTPTAPQWYSPVNPAGLDTPLDFSSQSAWSFLSTLLGGGLQSGLVSFYTTPVNQGGAGLTQQQAEAQAAADMAQILPGLANPGNINLDMRNLNTATGTFNPVQSVSDIVAMKPTIYNTFEFGYKGIFNNNLLVSADFYYTRAFDFTGPLIVETPNVFLNQNSLQTYLASQLGVLGLNPVAVGAIASGVAAQLTGLPIGVVAPQEAFYKDAMMLTYRNFGEIDYFGIDLGFEYLVNNEFRIMGNYSFISESEWLNLDGNPDFDIYLNAPNNKGSLGMGYNSRKNGLGGTLRARYVQGFKIESGIYNTQDASGTHIPIDDYFVVDLSLGYDIPNVDGLRLSVQVQNMLNNEQPQFAGTPDIGRLSIAGLSYSF